jgi:hypothetical protein
MPEDSSEIIREQAAKRSSYVFNIGNFFPEIRKFKHDPMLFCKCLYEQGNFDRAWKLQTRSFRNMFVCQENLSKRRKTMKSGLSLLVFSVVLLCLNVSAQENITEVSHRIAKAYGADSFSAISKIRYTFNLVRDTLHMARSWVWEPKANRVTFQNPPAQNEPLTYIRAEPGDTLPGPLRPVDKMFINDQYWLLFPLHLALDSMVTLSVKEDQPLPIGTGSMMQVTVSYPKSGGYTPGDAFDLFIDKSNRIAQWRYWRGGEKMLMTSGWEHYVKAGPILISLDRPGGTKNFKVWFTDVAVMMNNSNIWHPAQ